MNILKNMEIIFVATTVLVTAMSFATAGVPTFHASKNAQLTAAISDAKMQVVVITGKRLSAAEKAQTN